SFGRRPSSAHIAESKSLKNSGENTFCQSSASIFGRRSEASRFFSSLMRAEREKRARRSCNIALRFKEHDCSNSRNGSEVNYVANTRKQARHLLPH
ncbi:hypothetical protein ABIB75_008101, partial [Bradyrhizobium sp. GM2.2]|uniref:hypothetical protein n=1 Tax=Bradyrhizobium sp. GM2.2 TaxID=3156358 RepID=UPI003399D022